MHAATTPRLLLGSVYSFTDDQRAPSHWPLRPAAVQHVPIDRCHALQHLRTAGLEVLLAVWNRGRGLVAHEGCLVRTSLPWLAAVLHVGSATLGSVVWRGAHCRRQLVLPEPLKDPIAARCFVVQGKPAPHGLQRADGQASGIAACLEPAHQVLCIQKSLKDLILN